MEMCQFDCRPLKGQKRSCCQFLFKAVLFSCLIHADFFLEALLICSLLAYDTCCIRDLTFLNAF